MKNKILSVFFSIFMILNLSILCTAATYTVAENETIQSCLDNATSGDTIIVNPGYYQEWLYMPHSNLTLKAHGVVEVDGFTIGEPKTTIDGFHIYQNGITIVESTNCKIVNNYIELYTSETSNDMDTGSPTGIMIENCTGTIVNNNTIKDCFPGMILSGSSSRVINNHITNCSIGIEVYGVQNKIYNNYFKNPINVQFNQESKNSWNIEKTSKHNIIGGECICGNYWSTPDNTGFSDTAVDVNNDGIADSAYVMDKNNIDNYPLVLKGTQVNTSTNTTTEPTTDKQTNTNTTSVPSEDSTTDSSSSSKSHNSHSSSSGSSSSVGGSPEPAGNVLIKEITKYYITNDRVNDIKLKNVTDISDITVNSTKTFGQQTIIIEELKNRSTLTTTKPKGTVYKYFNIWIGSTKQINEKSVRDGAIYFKVNNTIADNSTINVSRYDNRRWIGLPVHKVGEDDNCTYYSVKTDAFGHFVVIANPNVIEYKTIKTTEKVVKDTADLVVKHESWFRKVLRMVLSLFN